jgi:hypothetical protein
MVTEMMGEGKRRISHKIIFTGSSRGKMKREMKRKIMRS